MYDRQRDYAVWVEMHKKDQGFMKIKHGDVHWKKPVLCLTVLWIN